MSAIVQAFQFQGSDVRAVLVNGEPWFVANDACAILGLANPRSSLALLDEDEKGVHGVDTPGGVQELKTVTEPGLYSLIFRSRRPEAKDFKRWVTHDVLPAIRKTGHYGSADRNLPAMPQTLPEALRFAADEIDKRERVIAELEPKAAQADQHRAADGCQLVGDFANELKAWAKRECGVRIKHEPVWDFLGEIGLLIRGNTVRHNSPTAFATERDFVRKKTSEFETNTRGLQESTSPRLTPAGAGWAWDRAVKRIRDHGSLTPTKAIEGVSS